RAIGATLDFFGKFFNGLGQLFGWVKPVGENGEQLAQTVEQTVSSAAQFGKAIGAVMGGLMAMSIGLKAFRGMKALWDGGKASWKAITSIWKKGGAAAEAASNTTQGKTGNRLSNLFGGGDDDSKDRGKDQKGGKTGKGSKGLDAKKMFGGVDAKGLLAIGGAMVMVAGAVWILSDALTKIAEIPSDRIWEVTGVMGAIAGGAALITGAMILLAPVVTASIPALLAIGGAFLAVGAGVGIASAGIGKLAEGFAKLKTAGAEADAIKMRAQADATERLSKIPAERIHAVADAIKSMSSALATMGDTVGSDGWFSDSGVDVDKQMEQVSVFKMFASVDSAGIIETSSALNTMIDTYGRFATLDLDSISKATRVMAEVKEATDPGLLTKATNFFGGLFGSDEPEVKKPEPQETPKPEQSKTEPKQKEAPKPEQTKTEPKQKPSGELEKDLWKRNRRDMNPYERAIDKQERTRARLEKQQLATPKSYLGNTNTADTAPEPPRPDTEAVKPVELSTTLSEADVARMDPAQKAMLELMAQLVKNTETSAIESKRSRKTLSSIHQDW
ncbi:MAG TPA: hypothetical protein VLA40_12130, partial [Rheinheimera sp.]|nr:hypothetical protein [Rheinheimera sp.]